MENCLEQCVSEFLARWSVGERVGFAVSMLFAWLIWSVGPKWALNNKIAEMDDDIKKLKKGRH